MKKKILSFLLVLSLLVTLIVPFTVTTASADGIAITNQSGLENMGTTGSYYLDNDITISGTWTGKVAFTGELNGQGHTITFADGVTINGGLFKELRAKAYVHDLRIVQAGSATWNYYTSGVGAVAGSIGAVAAFVGANGDQTEANLKADANKVRIENVTATVTISESAAVSGSNEAAAIGGIVGSLCTYTAITNCIVNGSIADSYDHNGTNTSAASNAERSAYGGIVGLSYRRSKLDVTECINNASVTGKGQQGGILGGSTSVDSAENVCTVTIQRCINNGTVTCNGTATTSSVGGIAGYIFSQYMTEIIRNNINNGSLAKASGSAYAAGIVARIRRGQDNKVQFLGNVQRSGTLAGGNNIVYQQDGGKTVIFTNNYGVGDGDSTYTKVDGSTFNALKAAYPNVFALYGATGGTNIGLQCEHGASNGVASTANIATEGDLFAALSTGSGTYTLTSDITIHKFWNNNAIFKGTLNGNSHTITFADGTVIYGGLFQFMSIGATVKNLNIVQDGNAVWRTVNKSVTGYYAGTGAIGGLTSSIFGADGSGEDEANKITIQKVTVTANINVTETVNSSNELAAAGLVGYLRYANVIIDECKFKGSLTVSSITPTTQSAFGGIVGMIPRITYRVEITNCINEADINAPCNVGGILGWSRYWYNDSEGEANKWALAFGIKYLSVEQCMNRGAIICTGNATKATDDSNTVGGIIGYAFGVNKSKTYVRNNINYGAVSFTGSAKAYPGGICGRARYNNGAMVFEGNINYGSLSVVDGTTAPILNWNNDAYRLNGAIDDVEAEDGEIQHQNNYAVAGRHSTSGAGATNDGQMTAEIIETSSYNAFTTLKSEYPGVYTLTGSGKISLMWELGDLSYQAKDSYSTSVSLSLDGTIQMRIGVGASCVVPSDKGVTLTVEKDSTSTTFPIYNAFDSSSGYFIYSYSLTAKEMADSHTYTVTIKEGSTTIKSSSFSISVKEYANAILAQSNYSEWHSLMTAMLNYGAAAQNYFEYNMSDLAGSTNITFDTTGLPSVEKVSGDSSILTDVFGSMNLNSGTDLNLYVKPANSNDSLNATVKNSIEATVNNATCKKVESGDLNGYWLIKIPNLSADQLSETFNITVSNGSKSIVFSYSALCWVNALLSSVDTKVTDAMKVLASGIGAYAAAAQAISSQNQPILFASQGVSPYAVSYSPVASDYLKSTALSVTRNLNKDDVRISATTAPDAGQRLVDLKTSPAVSNYKIEYESNGNVTITGNDDRWTALGALEFFNVLLKKNSNGDYIVSDPQTYTPSNATNYERTGWLLAAPAYAAGNNTNPATLSSGMYDDGTGLGTDKNAPDGERSYMMSISGTTAAQFNTYKSRLTSCGYTEVASKSNSSNQFFQYKKGNQLLYCYFVSNTKVVRVIEDRASTPEDEFEYNYSSSSSTATDLCMYGMYYTSDGYTVNNGAFNLIKQADGSVILIDGGRDVQATDAAITGLWTYLHTLTGTSYNAKLKIACWFVTHPHGDHYALVSALIEKYHDNIDLQRVMFNFPNAEVVGTHVIGTIRDAARQYFPNTKFLKCHTGQSIKLGTLTMDIMTTQEDLVDASTGTTGTLSDGNLLTSVCRFTFADGTKYMEVGDFDESRQTALINMYNASEFSCKVTSVAHHGYNVISSLYAKIGARYAFFPNYVHTNFNTSTSFGDGNGSWRKNKCSSTVSALKSANSSVEIFYAGSNTVKLTCQNGSITKELVPNHPVY